jgi:taurine dioxygenase
MSSITERPLTDDFSFGTRVTGVNWETVKDEGVRKQINDIFERRGLIIFENMEPSGQMQLELSSVFGPLREHAMKAAPRVDQGAMSVVMDLNFHPDDADIYEVNGKQLCGWIPWHYDACYTSELYRGGLLRAIAIPLEGGMTGFADGVQLYKAISPELRTKFEDLSIVYHPKLMLMNQRFGMPKQFRAIRVREATLTLLEQAENAPRAVHPAIWKRKSGEKVLHVSPWQAAGIEGREDQDGDALLETLCQEIYGKMNPYWHKWKPTDMVIWDNWRFVHSVNGHDPKSARRVHRVTIEGDYGLGRFEADAKGTKPLEMY